MRLKLFQESFIQQVSSSSSADDFLKYLEPCGDLLPDQQLAIYQNNVHGALQKSLAQTYPVCKKILGEKYFKQLASLYIRNYPSVHYDLNVYGEHFSDFIGMQNQLREELKDFPYLSDLAKLEWFYHQIFYAAQASVFDFLAYSQLSEPQQAQSVFQLVPCFRFMSSDYPIVSIWQLNQNELDTQQTVSSKAEKYCIFRNNNHIELIPIDTMMYTLLSHIKAGKMLAELVQMDIDDDLPKLIKQGWIGDFKVKHV
jgi:hypothetical protein